MGDSNRIIKNTLFLYSRTILSVLLNLYSTRVVMEMLGVSDYGLYYVIGGVIAMLSVVNNAMAVSTQRNISVSLGTGETNTIKSVVGNTISLHLLIGIIILLFFEIIGLYYINYKLVFDSSKAIAANLVFQFVVVSSFVSIVSVPYDAILNATEQMKSIALIGVVEALLKVIVAWSLIFFRDDRLIVFGFLTMLSALFIRAIKWRVVSIRFKTYLSKKLIWNSNKIKSLGFFAGWNLFGSVSYMARTQGLSLVLNLFFGTVMNAAYGIASQISIQITFVCSALMQAIIPQIMKSEGANNRGRMLELAFSTSKISFLLVSVVAIPLMFEMPFIISWWLQSVPPFASYITIMFLVSVLLNQLTAGLDSAIHATGEIKGYMLLIGLSKILVLPISYLLLVSGNDVRYVFLFYALFEGIGSFIRLFVLKRLCQINVAHYCLTNLLPLLAASLIIALVLKLFTTLIIFEYRWIVTIILSFLIFPIVAWFFVLNGKEKSQVYNCANALINKTIGRKILFK